jgi:Holliday junction DNA helicase RuvA
MILHIKGNVEYIDRTGFILFSIFPGFSFQVEYIEPVLENTELSIWVYSIMKEIEGKIDIKLYGFQNRDMIAEFEKLMTISGVGPKMAFNLLKTISKENLIEIVVTGDYAAIKKVPGIGDKLAKRIVLELSRLYTDKDDILEKINIKPITSEKQEVLDTLVQMGFEKKAVLEKLGDIDSGLTKKDILKEVLILLTKNDRSR